VKRKVRVSPETRAKVAAAAAKHCFTREEVDAMEAAFPYDAVTAVRRLKPTTIALRKIARSR
jgi:hypothetical protein